MSAIPPQIWELHNLFVRNLAQRYTINYQTVKRLFQQNEESQDLQLDHLFPLLQRFLVAIPAPLIHELIHYYDFNDNRLIPYLEFAQLLINPDLLQQRHQQSINTKKKDDLPIVSFDEEPLPSSQDIPRNEIKPPIPPPIKPITILPRPNRMKLDNSNNLNRVKTTNSQPKQELDANNSVSSTSSSYPTLYVKEIITSPRGDASLTSISKAQRFCEEKPIPGLKKALLQLLRYLKQSSNSNSNSNSKHHRNTNNAFKGIHIHEIIPDEHPYLHGYDVAIDIREGTKPGVYNMKIHAYTLGGGSAAPYYDDSYLLSLDITSLM